MKYTKRVKDELHITKPVALVLGGERFVIPPPASLLRVRTIETIEDELRPFTDEPKQTLKRVRLALRVRGRVLAVAKPNGDFQISKSEPGEAYIITMSTAATLTRRNFRSCLM